MESENPFFCFPIVYGSPVLICKVIMQDVGYDIEFDGRWMASIAHTDDWTWIQSAGVILPAAIIEEIGLKIESHYK